MSFQQTSNAVFFINYVLTKLFRIIIPGLIKVICHLDNVTVIPYTEGASTNLLFRLWSAWIHSGKNYQNIYAKYPSAE